MIPPLVNHGSCTIKGSKYIKALEWLLEKHQLVSSTRMRVTLLIAAFKLLPEPESSMQVSIEDMYYIQLATDIFRNNTRVEYCFKIFDDAKQDVTEQLWSSPLTYEASMNLARTIRHDSSDYMFDALTAVIGDRFNYDPVSKGKKELRMVSRNYDLAQISFMLGCKSYKAIFEKTFEEM